MLRQVTRLEAAGTEELDKMGWNARWKLKFAKNSDYHIEEFLALLKANLASGK